MKRTSFIIIAIASCNLSIAQTQTPFAISKATTDACSRYFADRSIDPVRSKLPIGLNSVATDAMKANEKKPNALEINALKAFDVARVNCGLYIEIDLSKWLGRDPDLESAESNDANLTVLKGGKITYAEYFRLVQKASDDIQASANKAYQAHISENLMRDWISKNEAQYGSSTLWPPLVNDLLAITRQIDAKGFTPKDGESAIAQRWSKFTNDLSAANTPKPVALNCTIKPTDVYGIFGQLPTHDITLTLDYAKSQVNGILSSFSQTLITWKFGSGSEEREYELNRLSGSIRITPKTGLQFSGHCTQVTAAQF